MNSNMEVDFSSTSNITKAYAAPQLICFGSVRDVTGGSAVGQCKGGNSAEGSQCNEGGQGQGWVDRT